MWSSVKEWLIDSRAPGRAATGGRAGRRIERGRESRKSRSGPDGELFWPVVTDPIGHAKLESSGPGPPFLPLRTNELH